MTDWQIQQRAAKREISNYPKGTRILIEGINENNYHESVVGQKATVDFVDDMGQVFCIADNGEHITLCHHYGDKFEKIEEDEK